LNPAQPDPYRLACRTGCHQLGDDDLAKVIERQLIAKEERLVVVIASTTSTVTFSTPALIFCTSSLMPETPALRTSGKQPAFDQITACQPTARDRSVP